MRKGNLLFLIMGLSLVHACATLPGFPPVRPQPEELCKRLEARTQALQGLKGLAQVKITSPEKSWSGQQVIFARSPAALRIESLSPLGIPQFYMVTDGLTLNFYNPRENLYYRGPTGDQRLASFLPIALEPREMVSFLCGGVPKMDTGQVYLREDPKETLWILELVSPQQTVKQILWVQPQTLDVLRAELHHLGSVHRLTFADFRPLEEFRLPHRLQWSDGQSRFSIAVYYQEVEINPSWEVNAFQLPVPPGATVAPLP